MSVFHMVGGKQKAENNFLSSSKHDENDLKYSFTSVVCTLHQILCLNIKHQPRMWQVLIQGQIGEP